MNATMKAELVRRHFGEGVPVNALSEEFQIPEDEIRQHVEFFLDQAEKVFEQQNSNSVRNQGRFSIAALFGLTFFVALCLAYPFLLYAAAVTAIITIPGFLCIGLPILLLTALTSPARNNQLDVSNNVVFPYVLRFFFFTAVGIFFYLSIELANGSLPGFPF